MGTGSGTPEQSNLKVGVKGRENDEGTTRMWNEEYGDGNGEVAPYPVRVPLGSPARANLGTGVRRFRWFEGVAVELRSDERLTAS
jgi:hypothetical protein